MQYIDILGRSVTDLKLLSDSDAKAAEAAQSAYYDPNKPQCAYVPPPSYYVRLNSDAI